METAREVELAIRGANIRIALPDIQSELKELEEKRVKEVMGAIASGDLTSEIAVSKWHDIYALRELERRLRQRTKIGEPE